MLEFDMHEVEFHDPADDDAISRTPAWTPTMELYAELRLLTVAESETERKLQR